MSILCRLSFHNWTRFWDRDLTDHREGKERWCRRKDCSAIERQANVGRYRREALTDIGASLLIATGILGSVELGLLLLGVSHQTPYYLVPLYVAGIVCSEVGVKNPLTIPEELS